MGQGIEVHSVLKGIPPPKLYDYLSATSDVHFKGDNLLHLIEENRRMRVLISSIKLDIFLVMANQAKRSNLGHWNWVNNQHCYNVEVSKNI